MTRIPDERNIAGSELIRYLEHTEEICRLSVPQIREIDGADSYRETLFANYLKIGDIAKENARILSESLYPKLESEEELGEEEIRSMCDFSHALNDAYKIDFLDSPLVYRQALRMLNEADRTSDDDLRVIALDEVVSAAYAMMCITGRLVPVSDMCMEYSRVGLDAAERLLEYLDKDRFASLSEEAREMVVINARYIRVVSEIDGLPGEPEQNALLLKRMKDALDMARDPFYRDLLPDYDWELHEFRTLEYICSLPDYNNEKRFGEEDLVFINECTKRMGEMYYSDNATLKQAHQTHEIELYICRNAYLTGEISRKECKKRLVELSIHDSGKNITEDVPLVMLHAPFEYIMLLDPEDLSEDEKDFLNERYNALVTYMHQTPKMGRFTFLLTYTSLILKNFIQVPGGKDFETMCLDLIAALHPPTYVHTLCVADFTSCLTRHLLARRPELFVGMPGVESPEDAKAMADEIIDYAYHAALCHDFGKLAITETILTYGRELLDEERELIRIHPSMGAYLLSRFEETKEYADIARGHHKWFDNSTGYPEDFDLEASPYRTIVSLVTCADCLDAATDSVGRSYKVGKTLQELITEFEEGSGTRYAPFVVELLHDDEVVAEVSEIIEKERDRNYRKTYRVLKDHGPESDTTEDR